MSDDDTENYLKERKLLIDAQQQSYQQFDKAILTLSSGGLGVSIIFLRDILGSLVIRVTQPDKSCIQRVPLEVKIYALEQMFDV